MLLFVVALYLILVTFELPFVFTSIATGGGGVSHGDSLIRSLLVETDNGRRDAPQRPQKPSFMSAGRKGVAFSFISGLRLAGGAAVDKVDSELERSAKDAWALGGKLLTELESEKTVERQMSPENRSEACPDSISLSGEEFYQKGKVMVLPCGLTLGSHITLVGKPYRAHEEYDPKISTLKEGSKSVWVSQFMMELQGLKTVDREEPPKILHFNPRLKGDWSGKPVIEQNTCYRMQWGSALRCEGWKSKADEETGTLFCL